MAKFRKKPVKLEEVEATQWFKNGDHPEDNCRMIRPDPKSETQFEPFLSEGKIVRRFRRPDIGGDAYCHGCGQKFYDHGWIDTEERGFDVCPGSWIITSEAGERYPLKDPFFKKAYEPVED